MQTLDLEIRFRSNLEPSCRLRQGSQTLLTCTLTSTLGCILPGHCSHLHTEFKVRSSQVVAWQGLCVYRDANEILLGTQGSVSLEDLYYIF